MVNKEVNKEVVNCNIKLENRKFILANILAYSFISYEIKKKSYYRCQNVNNRNLLFLVEITFDGPDLYCQLCWIFHKFLRNYIWLSTSIKNVATLNIVNSLTVNSVMDIFQQVSENFQNTVSKSEHMLDNIFF